MCSEQGAWRNGSSVYNTPNRNLGSPWREAQNVWPSYGQKPDTCTPAPPRGCWAGPVLEGKPRHAVGELASEPVQSTPGWASSGLINGPNLSFQGERKRFQLCAILQKAELWRQLKDEWLSGVCREEYTEYRWSHEQWKCSERHYNDGYMWSYFVQTHRLCNTAVLIKVNPKKKKNKVNPKVNWGRFDYASMQSSLV